MEILDHFCPPPSLSLSFYGRANFICGTKIIIIIIVLAIVVIIIVTDQINFLFFDGKSCCVNLYSSNVNNFL